MTAEIWKAVPNYPSYGASQVSNIISGKQWRHA
jgi:hypothetical protein